jgi:hypothetical protein
MSATTIITPFPVFNDVDGNPLENGKVYIGNPGLNPIVSPATAYWDTGLTTPAAQPVRTIGGFLSNGGTPGQLYIDGDYSIVVYNKNDTLIHTSLNNADRMSAEFVGIDDNAGNTQFTTVQGFADMSGFVIDTYANLRLVESSGLADAKTCLLTDAGIFGQFVLDKTDAVTADNAGTTIVDTDGGRWHRKIVGNTYNARWWGADGDDAEYATEIQNAIDVAETTGGIVKITYGVQGLYDINTQILVPSNIIIDIDPNVLISSSMEAFTGVGEGVFNMKGATSGSTLALTANADEFDTSVELSVGDAATLAVGDMVWINDPTTVDAGVYYQNEPNIVQAISGTTVTMKYPLNFDYTTANASIVQKLAPVENSEVRGGTINLSGATTGQVDAVTGEYAYNCKVSNVKGTGHRGMVAELWYSLHCTLENIKGNDAADKTPGHGYVSRYQHSRHSAIIGGYGITVRHAADFTGGSDLTCTGMYATNNSSDNGADLVPAIAVHGLREKRIKIYGNTIENSDRGIGYGNPTFDASYDVIIENNTISLCGIGIYALENCLRSQILDNNIRESTEAAIAVLSCNDILIANNRCKGSTANNGKGLINIFSGEEIEICDNIITTSDLAGIKMAGCADMDIHHNRIATSATEAIVGTTLTKRIRVCNNIIDQEVVGNTANAIDLDGATYRTIVCNNDIVGSATIPSGIELVDSGVVICDDNTINLVTEGIRILNSNHPVIRNNYINNVTNGIRLVSGTINDAVVQQNHVTNASGSEFLNSVAAVNFGRQKRTAESTAAPGAGTTWAVGDIVWKSNPAVGQPIGWMCTVAGDPATFVAMANL